MELIKSIFILTSLVIGVLGNSAGNRGNKTSDRKFEIANCFPDTR